MRVWDIVVGEYTMPLSKITIAPSNCPFIVLDHDNLSRAISQTIERIEQSHARGETCALYAELDRSVESTTASSHGGIKVPRVYTMKQEIHNRTVAMANADDPPTKHFHPGKDQVQPFLPTLHISFSDVQRLRIPGSSLS